MEKQDKSYIRYLFLIIFFRFIALCFSMCFLIMLETKFTGDEKPFLSCLFFLFYLVILFLYNNEKHNYIARHYTSKEDVSSLLEIQKKYIENDKNR